MPYPTRTTHITTFFWMSLFTGLAGLAGGVWGILDNAGTNMTMVCAIPLAVAGLVMIAFAFRHRTETWIWFPVCLDGHTLRYSRCGPEPESFDSFTGDLIGRIKIAQRNQYGKHLGDSSPELPPDATD